MRAEVVIPSWERRDDLRRALASLGLEDDVGVCVIDNGSSDGTAAMVRSEFPAARLIALERNAGFGAAVNMAARTSRGQFLILMNNDAVADPGFIAALIAAREASGAAMVAGCMVDSSGLVESAGVTVDQSLTIFDHLNGARREDLSDASVPPLGPSGGAALYERDAFLAVGGFDERIFAYLEDVDLALRLRIAGHMCALATGATVLHRHSSTLGMGSSAKNRLMVRNRRYLEWKYGRNLSRARRARGAIIELIVLLGRVVIDRNFGGIAGWRDGAREFPMTSAPPADPRFREVPLERLSAAAALRRRLRRRT